MVYNLCIYTLKVGCTMLSRKAAREQAFILIFEKSFNDYPVEEILETAKSIREFETDDYTISVFTGVFDNLAEMDALISQHSKGWALKRINRVSLSILRLAIYEMLYRDDIPVSVSVNEAVELCKKYATTEDASFVNGILGAVSRHGEGGDY